MKDSIKVVDIRNKIYIEQNDDENKNCYGNKGFETALKNSNDDNTNDMYFTVEKPVDVLSQVNGLDTSWMILDGKKYEESSSSSAKVDLVSSSGKIENKNLARRYLDYINNQKILKWLILFLIFFAFIIVFSVTIIPNIIQDNESNVGKHNYSGTIRKKCLFYYNKLLYFINLRIIITYLNTYLYAISKSY